MPFAGIIEAHHILHVSRIRVNYLINLKGHLWQPACLNLRYSSGICLQVPIKPIKYPKSQQFVLWLWYKTKKVKVKVTPVQALRLCTGCTAHRGSRGIALLFHDQRHLKWVRRQRHAPAALFPRPVPTVQEAGWAPGPLWTGADNLATQPGFNPQTIKPIASRYTDYATQPTIKQIVPE